ncbi:restriction endonuclease subunit S [Vibrio splendidus]|uniref:restriction endonuclease subunit S n=1 Tax=Vibrio splendidus TaxID=29497 RepID=UPI002235E8C4|nr:restriction endonuclease subunit S [Vibrio splendidus]MCW4440052.1 restriction endonuclease subunit S [Vibrio splendidus]
MGNEWINTELGDVIELKRGYDLPKTKRINGSVPVVSSSGHSGLHNEVKIKSPGVVTGRYGTIGQVFYIEEDFWPLNTTLYVKDFKGNDPLFIYYYLKTVSYKDYTDKGAVPGVNRNDLHRAKVSVPKCPKYQNKLATHLRDLDKKITLNNQINQTLEQMAQTLFKSWFVDFDPVKAKMNGEQPKGMDAPFFSKEVASLFPEKLVESELGELPEGWKLVPVGDLLANAIGGDWGKEVPDEKHTEEVRIVRGTDIPKLHGGAIDSVPVRYVESKKLKTRKLERGDIVIEVSGGSKDQPTGRSLFISDNILKRLDLPSEPASFCRRFKPVSYEIGLLLAVHFQLMYQAGKTWEYQNQSTGISNFQTKYFLEAEHVVIPSEDVLEAFIKQVNPMMDMIHSNQNIELAKLRDTLLPKLLSGEVDLESVQVEQAKALTE